MRNGGSGSAGCLDRPLVLSAKPSTHLCSPTGPLLDPNPPRFLPCLIASPVHFHLYRPPHICVVFLPLLCCSTPFPPSFKQPLLVRLQKFQTTSSAVTLQPKQRHSCPMQRASSFPSRANGCREWALSGKKQVQRRRRLDGVRTHRGSVAGGEGGGGRDGMRSLAQPNRRRQGPLARWGRWGSPVLGRKRQPSAFSERLSSWRSRRRTSHSFRWRRNRFRVLSSARRHTV